MNRFRLAMTCLCSVLSLALLSASAAHASIADDLDTRVWSVNDPVLAMARIGDTLYVGGWFTRTQCVTGGGAPVDGTTGQELDCQRIEGSVFAIVPDGAGGWYLGGLFSHIGGVPRRNLAHVSSDNTLLPWDPSPDAAVYELLLDGSTLYVAGNFNSIGGQGRSRLAAYDVGSEALLPWNPNPDGQVNTVAVSGSTVYLGGFFNNVGGQPRSKIAAVDAATGAVSPWDPHVGTSQFFYHVRDLVVLGTTVYIGGQFVNVGGQARRHVAALDSATGFATAWNPNPDSLVYVLLANGGAVYAGGEFSHIGGQARSGLARLDPVSGAVDTWNPSGTMAVTALAPQGTSLYVGRSVYFGTTPYIGSAQLVSTINGAPAAWNPYPNGPVRAIGLAGAAAYLGGDFSAVGGVARNHLAAFDLTTGRPTDWNPNANDVVYSLIANGPTLYVAGSFSSVDGQVRHLIAAVDPIEGHALPWNPNPATPFGAVRVNAMALSDHNTLYAGGRFHEMGGLSREYLAEIDLGTAATTAWNPQANSDVNDLDAADGTVYVGGDFLNVGGQPRNRLAALDGITGLASAWDPSPDGTVYAIRTHGSTVYVGGNFGNIGLAARKRLAEIDASGSATPWNPQLAVGPLGGGVKVIMTTSSSVIAGGEFLSAGGVLRRNLVELDASTAAPTDWNPDVSYLVQALDAQTPNLYVGGWFDSVATHSQPYLAGVPLRAALLSVPTPDPMTGFEISALGPNPAWGPIRIDYQVGRPASVRLGVFDLQGREVARLVDAWRPAGRHRVTWDGTQAARATPAGLYFLRYQTEGWSTSRRLVRLR